MHTLKNHGTRFALLAAGFSTAVGCANPVNDAKDNLESARAAIESPSGEVQAGTISEALAAQAESGNASNPLGGGLGYRLELGDAPMFRFRSGSTDTIQIPDARNLYGLGVGLGGFFGDCAQEDDNSLTIDFGCLSSKDPSFGDMSGEMVYTFDEDENTSTHMVFHMEYRNVCQVSEDICIDGMGAYETDVDPAAGTFDILATGDFTISHAGETIEYQFAVHTTLDENGNLKLEYLVYVNGETFVMGGGLYDLDTSLAGDGTQQGGFDFTIRGANGTYECNYGQAGAAGTCNGPGGQFEWTNQ